MTVQTAIYRACSKPSTRGHWLGYAACLSQRCLSELFDWATERLGDRARWATEVAIMEHTE